MTEEQKLIKDLTERLKMTMWLASTRFLNEPELGDTEYAINELIERAEKFLESLKVKP